MLHDPDVMISVLQFLWDAEGIDDEIAEDDFGAEVETDDPTAAPELDYSKQMAELQEAFEN